MKVRQGFVSNSSSTSFVIALSRDLDITDKIIKTFIEDYRDHALSDDDEDLSPEDARRRIKFAIDKLCDNEGFVDEGESDEENDAFFVGDFLTELFPDIVIASIDSSSGMGCYTNILSDKSKQETLKKLKKIVDKG